MKILYIQENGRHEKNRNFRECLSLQRATIYNGHEADVWGLNHEGWQQLPDWESYDLIVNLENYDSTGWVPNLNNVQTKKFLWSIDAHVRGMGPYLKTAHDGNYDLILQSTPEYVDQNSVWFPNCYDDDLIQPLSIDKSHDIGFCGNVANRRSQINFMINNHHMKFDEMIIGKDMVEAINSYKIHWNLNISNDINYRNFETMGCQTVLLTSPNKHYEKLGFINGENYVEWNSLDEIHDIINNLLGSDEKMNTIAKSGYSLVKSKHTYKNRIKMILEILNK